MNTKRWSSTHDVLKSGAITLCDYNLLERLHGLSLLVSHSFVISFFKFNHQYINFFSQIIEYYFQNTSQV